MWRAFARTIGNHNDGDRNLHNAWQEGMDLTQCVARRSITPKPSAITCTLFLPVANSPYKPDGVRHNVVGKALSRHNRSQTCM